MDDSSAIRQSRGEITSGITREDTLILNTINFVFKQLPAWRDDPNRPDKKSEDELNLQLCKFLNSQARYNFPMVRFGHEEPQTGRRRVDVAASIVETAVIGAKTYTIYDPFLVFEGKRLPAPSSNREKEYVTGFGKKTGGIQRFKLGLHGAYMASVAMIGYIQERSPHEWHTEINKWISELCNSTIVDNCDWNNDESLKIITEDQSGCTTSYQSVHGRSNSTARDKLLIYHLWVIMNTNKRSTEHPCADQ